MPEAGSLGGTESGTSPEGEQPGVGEDEYEASLYHVRRLAEISGEDISENEAQRRAQRLRAGTAIRNREYREENYVTDPVTGETFNKTQTDSGPGEFHPDGFEDGWNDFWSGGGFSQKKQAGLNSQYALGLANQLHGITEEDREELYLRDPSLARADSADIAAQRDALSALGNPNTQESIARREATRGSMEAMQAGAAGANLQGMNEAGTGAAGGYASALGNAQMQNQGAANWQSQMAGQQEEQRRAALAEMGRLGGQVRRQDVTARRTNAGVIDSWNASNMDAARGRARRNIDRRNDAMETASDIHMGRAVHYGDEASKSRGRSAEQVGGYVKSLGQLTNTGGGSSSGGGSQGYDDTNEYG